MRRNKAIALSGWCIAAGISLAGHLSGWVWACNTLCLLLSMAAGCIWTLQPPTAKSPSDAPPFREFDAREWNAAVEVAGFGAVDVTESTPPATLPAPTRDDRLADRFALVARDATESQP